MDQTDSTPFYYQPRYLLMILLFIFCIRYFLKKKKYSSESISERIWRKLAFSYQELLNTFDPSERELLKHTYQNTVFNTQSTLHKESIKKTSTKSTGRVSFDLDKNITHTIPQKENHFD